MYKNYCLGDRVAVITGLDNGFMGQVVGFRISQNAVLVAWDFGSSAWDDANYWVWENRLRVQSDWYHWTLDQYIASSDRVWIISAEKLRLVKAALPRQKVRRPDPTCARCNHPSYMSSMNCYDGINDRYVFVCHPCRDTERWWMEKNKIQFEPALVS